MATKLKYDLFRAAFDEEATRYAELQSTARILLGICTFFLGAVGLKVNEFPDANSLAFWLILVGAASFGLAFLCLVRALEMLDYYPLLDPDSVLSSLPEGAPEPPDDEFLDDRIGDLLKAIPQNVESNEKRADRLTWATKFILLGIALTFAGMGYQAWA